MYLLSQRVGSTAESFGEGHRLGVVILSLREGADVDQSFYGIRELSVEAELSDTGYSGLKDLSDMGLHVFCLVAVLALTLDSYCLYFGGRGAFSGIYCESGIALVEPLVVVACKYIGDYAVYSKVRIAADRGGEVSIVLQYQAEVSKRFCGVLCLCH